MATIKQIDGRSIHQIQSGQVIVDLCSVVKELVENSVDAGATVIDVRFKNQGLDLIEVQDNGSGISPANYHSVALKHHTSKLSSYSDIATLQTFGFRGEALASLCALSILTVTTCTAQDVPRGSKLTFELSGKLKDTSVAAVQRGTTVSVENLFYNLPVRRRELDRNIKKEWQKVIALLNQYACIQTDLKFSVSHQPTKGRRVLLFSTKGNPTTRENIINIFGAKTMTALVSLDLRMELNPSATQPTARAGREASSVSREVRVLGHVSRPFHGDGRQTPDRQMFFVNGRPCALPQFAKAFNEVYRSYNSSQSPFIFADIRLDTDLYDVNVSPDKRSILLHDQNHMLDKLRTSLTSLFDAHEYSVPVSQSSRTTGIVTRGDGVLANVTKPLLLSEGSEASQESQESPGSDSTLDDHIGETDAEESLPSRRIRNNGNKISRSPKPRSTREQNQSLLAMFARHQGGTPNLPAASSSTASNPGVKSQDSPKTRRGRSPIESIETECEDEMRQASLFVMKSDRQITSQSRIEVSPDPSYGATRTRPAVFNESSPQRSIKEGLVERPRQSINAEMSLSQRNNSHAQIHQNSPEVPSLRAIKYASPKAAHADPKPSQAVDTQASEEMPSCPIHSQPGYSLADDDDSGREDENDANPKEQTEPEEKIEEQPRHDQHDPEQTDSFEIVQQSTDLLPKTNRISPVPLAPEQSMPRVLTSPRRKDITARIVQRLSISEHHVQGLSRYGAGQQIVRVQAGRDAPQVEALDAADAESKLSLIIAKSDFGQMRIAGQFNLGFIIAVRPANIRADKPGPGGKLKHDELFIIDQHASDEKFNFERLQTATIIEAQRLVHPKRLQLTALEEEILLENASAVEANGFKVDIDTTGRWPVGSRCLLTALPICRETTFDLKDLEELISLLGDHNSESTRVLRPSKVRKVLAMRACRGSVMIGKALSKHQMEGLVKHMGELDKPWNCPHGRPTMRHLTRLSAWDEAGWNEDGASNSFHIWKTYVEKKSSRIKK